MAEQGSVTVHIQQLRHGSAEAEREIFVRYVNKLVARASGSIAHMPGLRLGAWDPEMAAQSALRSALERIRDGRERRSLNRDGLWAVLLGKLNNKIIDQWRWEHAEKRGNGAVRYAADVLAPAPEDSARDVFGRFPSDDPTPEEVHQLNQLFAHAITALPDDASRQIAQLELEGHTDVEIGHLTGKALRTVQLKLCLIRETWKADLNRDAY